MPRSRSSSSRRATGGVRTCRRARRPRSAVLAVVMWSGTAETGSHAGASPVEDMDLLADADAPDFVDDGEDLEFYEWAAGEVES